MKTALLLGAVLFTGCATVGNRQIEDKNTVAKIIAGKSTKADVKALVGEPSKTTFSDNGEETWDYVLSRAQTRGSSFIPIVGLFSGGVDTQTYTLTVRFRKDGVVENVGSGKMTGGGGNLLDK